MHFQVLSLCGSNLLLCIVEYEICLCQFRRILASFVIFAYDQSVAGSEIEISLHLT